MNNDYLFKDIRNSRMELNNVYFWTDTIKDWKLLLKPEKYKIIIIDTLKDLVDKKLINVYGFVIMPNHIHLIWEMLSMHGNELPKASFNKATAHTILNDLSSYHPLVLAHFKVKEKERKFRVWQRDPLAILMDCRDKVEQKLDYIHLNPLNEKWNLANSPEEYLWSSANYYETGKDEFGILSHYMDRF